MTTNESLRIPPWATVVLGAFLVATIIAVQAAVYSRAVSAYETKIAELFTGDSAEAETYLRRALEADGTNGWAMWLLSKERLRRAEAAVRRAGEFRAAADRALKNGDKRNATAFRLAEKEQRLKQAKLLHEAEALAEQGTHCFNSVGCYKQLASIYLRQIETPQGERYLEDAERYFQIVARIKPNDIESIERLGLFKLRAKKWDELEKICDVILRRHPYSANAYFYKAFLAQHTGDAEAFFLNVRQAYMMMIQQTGPIFFERRKLEELAVRLNLVKAPRQSTTKP